MKKRKTPDRGPDDTAMPPPTPDNASDSLESTAHTAPDGSDAGQVERERPQAETGSPDHGRGSDAGVNDSGRGLGPDVESESDADSRSRRRDLGP
jgi:hypothetical protein